MIWTLLMTLAAWSAPCAETYSDRALNAELLSLDESLELGDLLSATVIAEEVHDHMLCMETVASPVAMARYARQQALIHFYRQDELELARWGQVVEYTWPSLPWSSSFGATHPFRVMIEEAEPHIGGSGRPLAAPRGGAVFWNGRHLTRGDAPTEVPALIQVAVRGHVIESWWQDGAMFPDAAVGDQVPSTPKWAADLPPGWQLAILGRVWQDTYWETSEVAHAAAALGYNLEAYDAEHLWNAWARDQVAHGYSPAAYYLAFDGTIPERHIDRARRNLARGRASGFLSLTAQRHARDGNFTEEHINE